MSRLTEHTFVCRSCAQGHEEPCSDFIETTHFGTVACFLSAVQSTGQLTRTFTWIVALT